MTEPGSTAAELGRAVYRLIDQVAHWTPTRWAAPSRSVTGGSRAEVAHAFAQELADLEARVTERAHRAVPVPTTNDVLIDQWRVLIRDLLIADPDPATLATAADAVSRTRAALLA